MLSTDYSGPFEDPQGSSGAEITTTAVDVDQPAPAEEDAFSVTSTLGDHQAAAEGDVLATSTNVESMESAIDQLLADTPLTRDDVELLVRTGTFLVALVALYITVEGQR